MERHHKAAHIDPKATQTPPTSIYAGIGARATPQPILAAMTKLADSLARTGWHLRSGGAHGADTAFADGAPAGSKTLYLPWPGYNAHGGPDCRILSAHELDGCLAIASRLHPNWKRCSPTVRKLHARNVAILLGPALDTPVDAVVCWTEGGAITGGTGRALRIAAEYRIAVLNLALVESRKALEVTEYLRALDLSSLGGKEPL